MTKRIKFTFIFILLFFITMLILFNPTLIIESVNNSVLLFFDKIFISMFPFFILSDILIHYNYPYYIGKIIGPFLNKLFKISNESAIVLILSMLSGHPGNAKYTKVLLDNKVIDEKEATKLIAFSYFPNPMFVIGSVGLLFLNDVKTGFLILILLYINNFAIGLVIRNKFVSDTYGGLKQKNTDFFNFAEILKTSIVNSFDTLIIILGNITVFTILGNLVFEYINFSGVIKAFASSLLEITGGINSISFLILNNNLKLALIVFALVFSGLCIHCQIFSILSNYKLNYKFIIKTRLISALVCFIISYLLF